MNGHERRLNLLRSIQEGGSPITGTDLAQALGVSRQIIVQDVAVLRAAGEEIISTPRGYMLVGGRPTAHQAILVTRHARHDAVDEMSIMVDHGLRIIDVVVEHPIYGELRAPLMFGSRSDILAWRDRIEATGAALLSDLTDGVHLHTVESFQPERIEHARDELRKRGFLVEDAACIDPERGDSSPTLSH
ncbi:MAG: transcription repressor NadR [Chloroflexota bacterium]